MINDHVVIKAVDELALAKDEESKEMAKWLNDQALKEGVTTYQLAQKILLQFYVRKPL